MNKKYQYKICKESLEEFIDTYNDEYREWIHNSFGDGQYGVGGEVFYEEDYINEDTAREFFDTYIDDNPSEYTKWADEADMMYE